MIKKIGVLLGIFTFLAVGSASAQTPKKREHYWGASGDSVGLDPAYDTDGNSFMIYDNVYEALVLTFHNRYV